MDSETLRCFYIHPVTVEEFPLASQNGMIEVYQSSDKITLIQSALLDITFIVPLEEVESSLYFLSGANNVYFACFIVSTIVVPFKKSYYFRRHLIEPIGVWLFMMINALSQNVRKALYHNPESGATWKCICMNGFSMDAFWYLVFKMSDNSIGTTRKQNQRIVKYYVTLQIELAKCKVRLTYLRILSQSSLVALRRVLGCGVGLGLAVKRPKVSNPEFCCRIGGIQTSVECPAGVPFSIFLKPDESCSIDGIDFIFYKEHHSLPCTIRFSKLIVTDENVAKARLPSAVVGEKVVKSGVYIGSWFLHDQKVLEVITIRDAFVTCSHVQEPDSPTIELPLH
jgi:hypothetical protein